MGNITGPLPAPDHDSAPFWHACAQHELRLQRCDDCEAFRFPPSPQCPHCGSHAHSWQPATGRGRVYSWIVVRHPVPKEVYGDAVPYVVALIDLDEGVRMASNLIGIDPDAVTADLAVEVKFEDVGDGISLPKFRPVDGG